jgi:hypothetical protein
MNCAGIEELLSGYIDGTLDAKAVQAVEKHISVCRNCKDTLDSLNDVIKELNALEPLKPPADFLEKIHQRMESRSYFRRLFKTFFIPFKIKLPLQLAAAAFASILVVMVLNIQKTEYQKMRPLKTSKSQWFAEKSKTDHSTTPELKMKAKPSAPVFEDAPESSPDIQQDIPPQRSRIKESDRPSIQRKPEPPSTASSKARLSAGKGHPPIELALVLKPAAFRGAYAPDTATQTAPFAGSDKHTVEKKQKDKGFPGVHLKAGQKNLIDDLLLRTTRMIRSLGGNILTKEYQEQPNRLGSIHAQLPAKNYISLCKALNQLAHFKTPPPDLSDDSPETVNLLINFTYPN